MNHRTLQIETFKYGNNYNVETIIVILDFFICNHSIQYPLVWYPVCFSQCYTWFLKTFIPGLNYDRVADILSVRKIFPNKVARSIVGLLPCFLAYFSYMADIDGICLGTYEYLYLVNHYYCLWGGAWSYCRYFSKIFHGYRQWFNVYGPKA